ncbi:alpha/beta hydrolase family protein [Paraburkholderia sediminicola]|uniref:hypothetical protein n=1 Tax=Paraburkholderia sediminicola TaxID=458836 RepID=UPI0038B8D850
MIDWQAAALAAARANAAYVMKEADSASAFSSLGDTWIGMYANNSHQAVLSADARGETHLSISGTRASAWKVMDVLADVSLAPVAVDGGNVTGGVLEGMQGLWEWVLATIPAGDVVHVAGHSLGASRTHLTPLFLPAAQIGQLHSFEAPKFADASFYAAHADALGNMVCVLNGADLWAAWPWKDPRWQARPNVPHAWIKDDAGGYVMIPGPYWPGGVDADDHDMSRVQMRVQAIAAKVATGLTETTS